MIELLSNPTFWIIILGSALLAATAGIVGTFAVLQQKSLLGDAISHAALPGVVLGFLIAGTKSTIFLLGGAFIIGLIATVIIDEIISNTKLKTDAVLGSILSIFFGFGMLLLTYTQKLPNANQAGLEKFLFGQAATLTQHDINIFLGGLFVVFIIIIAFWKQIKITLFDTIYAASIGVPVVWIKRLLTATIVLVIVLGLQTVGVVLISAMLIAPTAAARQWTNRLMPLLLLSGLFGGLAGLFGSAISAVGSNLPTGPVIVLIISVIVVISLVFSPNRGIIAQGRKNKKIKENYKI